MDNQNDTLNRYYAKKNRRREKKKYAFYTMLVVFFVLLITILSLTVFFNINDIAVTGNEHYSAETIIKVSGLTEGQNLFRLNKFKIIEGMYKQLPYASKISIDRHLPVGIEIIIEECKPFLYVETNGTYCILDENLKVLENTDTAPENLPLVMGITPLETTPGSVLTDADEISSRLATLTSALKEHIGDNCVNEINAATAFEMSFTYQDRIKINVGTVENIDTKLKLTNYVIEENNSKENAHIDVSSGEMAYYRPVHDLNEEVEIKPETEAEETPEDSTKENE